MKLVVIMGVTWIADVLSWAHNVAMKDSSTHIIKHDVRYYFWYIMDAINALQGVLIFLVVASQPQVSHFSKYIICVIRQLWIMKYVSMFKGFVSGWKILHIKK